MVDSSHRISKPQFPLCQLYQRFLETEVASLRHKHQEERPASPFGQLHLDEEFTDLLADMQAYCELVDRYCDASASAPSRGVMSVHRNLIQYRLLSREAGSGESELCRIVALIFSYGVIFPFPDPQPMALLVKRLEMVVQEVKADNELLLWALVMGGIGAACTSSEAWYMKELIKLTWRMNLRSWSKAKNILRDYLWSDRTCDQGALELWIHVSEGSVGGGAISVVERGNTKD
jgi:hypothetical protein